MSNPRQHPRSGNLHDTASLPEPSSNDPDDSEGESTDSAQDHSDDDDVAPGQTIAADPVEAEGHNLWASTPAFDDPGTIHESDEDVLGARPLTTAADNYGLDLLGDEAMDGAQQGSRARHHVVSESARKLEPFLNQSSKAFTPFGVDDVFVPSYLQESAYMQRLVDAHNAKIDASRRLLLSRQMETIQNSTESGNNSRTTDAALPLASPDATFTLTDAKKHAGHDIKPELKGLSPLPSRWDAVKKHAGLELGQNGLEVKCTGARHSTTHDHEACAVLANHHMPPQCGVYYYEVRIMSRRREDATVAVGFSTRTAPLSRTPGWEHESWGYHGDDGNSFAEQQIGKNYAAKFGNGDTIGCGVNFRLRCAFFTKNGEYLDVAFKNLKGGKFYPSISLKKDREHIRANFGHTRFEYNIDDYMRAEIDYISEVILRTNATRLASVNKETELVQQLVLQFLQHDGYVETAKSFAGEIREEALALNLDSDEVVPDVSLVDDQDARNRRQIRFAVLEGNVDKAITLSNRYYPEVLKEHDQVYFRLKCRKYIELIRREVEADYGRVDETKNFTSGSEHFQQVHSVLQQQEEADGAMDVDDDRDEPYGSSSSSSNNHRQQTRIENSKAVNGSDDSKQTLNDFLLDYSIETLEYGRQLQAEFSNDPRREVSKALDDVFSLAAYADPRKHKEAMRLLNREERVVVAEELNSAILESLGRSSRPALETLYAQTEVLLADISKTGGPESFISTKSVMNRIPGHEENN